MDGFMQRRREIDAKMKKECIWGAVILVVAFAAMCAACYVWGP